MLEITTDDIANLNDEDLRSLVGRLCEEEVLARGLQTNGVTWGGNQNAADGGIDVRVELPTDTVCHGFLPRHAIGFQVKKSDMPPATIAAEMRPDGNIRPSIQQLADRAGAYVIVSSGANVSDSVLKDRRDAMAREVGDVTNAPALFLDFYDRSRLATWVRGHAGLIPWVRLKAGRPLQGWRPYEGWALASDGVEDVYLADDMARLHGGNRDASGLPISDGIKRLRDSLREPCGVVRLAGLSGVGKTRLIQALFDPRVGELSLDPGLAVYTDIADSPDPPPTAMAENLIARCMRAILIVDNCPRDLHRRLAETCRKAHSTISVVTIEYDIQEDEPEGTDAYLLEPSSAELIKQIVRRRFKDISPVDAETIATFSGGNARVALALAGTLDSSETLAGLGDEELFRRLFHQRNAPDENLMRAAEVCSLIFSFEGETLVGDKAELPKLAALAELTTQDLYGRVRELKRRDLVQQRSVWRAVLPHAIANRLAKRALQNYPMQSIEAMMDTDRLLKSFAHRLSYLHDSPEAQQLAARWLEVDGMLGKVGELNELGREIFDFIAPVAPSAVLAALERAIARDGANLRGLAGHAPLLRSLAYDSENFVCSVRLLLALASSEDNQSANSSHVTDTFSSLFQIHYSGTEAPIGLRAPIIDELLHSDRAERRALGIKALEEALRTSHFNVTQPFEFGARPRNYGWWPKSAQDIADWYGAVLRIVEDILVSDMPLAPLLRDIFARKFRGLWRTGAVMEQLERITARIADHVYWQEGWIAVRKTQSQLQKDMPLEVRQRLDALERLLRPKDIIEQTQLVVLTESWGPLDYADAEADDAGDSDGQKMMRRIERASAMAQELGGSVGGDAKAFRELLPDLVRGKGGRLSHFGTGLAGAPGDRRSRWQALVSALGKVPPSERNLGVVAGYLTGLANVEPSVASALLDEAVEDAVLGPWLPVLQMAVPIDAEGLRRLSRALEVGLAPIGMFGNLAGGRYADSVSGPDFRQLVSAIAEKPQGYGVATDVLSMRIFSDLSKKKELAPELVEAGRMLLEGIVFERGDHMQDYRLSVLAKACLASPEARAIVIAIAGRVRTAAANYSLSIYDYDQFVLALLKVQPRAALDGFFGGCANDREAGRHVIERIASNQDNALDGVPDAVVLAWCEENRAERYAFMAQVVTYARSADKAPLQWTPLARAMLGQAPDPVAVLTIFVERFLTMTWNGSRAVEIEERARLLDDLSAHPNKAVSAYAVEKRKQLADQAARYRLAEAEEHRDRDERFE